MWYNTFWGAELILITAFFNIVYIIHVVFSADWDNVEPKYFVGVVHKTIWVRIAKSKKLNIVGKVCGEIFVSTYCLPAIAFLYITGLLVSVFGYIGTKLFFKESK